MGEGKGLPSFPHPQYPKAKWGWREAAMGKYNLAGLSVSNSLVDASMPDYEGEHKVKGWIVNGTNLIFTLPDISSLAFRISFPCSLQFSQFLLE